MAVLRLPRGTKLLVHVAVCMFGLASWVDINGMWVELPALVTRLPEGWTLPSYVIIISQVANVGPILFGLVTFLRPELRPERVVSYVIIGVGLVACVLLAFLWQHTAVIAGVERSVALLSLVAALSLVDCTSSLAFVALMASLKADYMKTYFIGEGLSGLVPSLLALIQGAGDVICVNSTDVNATLVNGSWHNVTTWAVFPRYREPRFSVQVFFLLLSALLLLSLLSLAFLHRHRHCRDQYIHHSGRRGRYGSTSDVTETSVSKVGVDNPAFVPTTETATISTLQQTADEKGGGVTVEQETVGLIISPGLLVFLLALVTWINMLITGFLLSIQTYSTLPYSIETYHLAAALMNVANPLACLLSLFLPTLSTAVITLVTALGSLCAAYIIAVAALSPHPPLSASPQGGGALVVLAWVLASFLLTYGKISVAGVLRLDLADGRRKLVWWGVFTQVGALVGAVTSFVMVNTYHVFQDAPMC